MSTPGPGVVQAEPDWAALCWEISCASGESFTARQRTAVAGGCINRALRLQGEKRSWFVKLNRASREGMFAAEADGLAALRKTGALLVPEPLCWGTLGEVSYLVLEWLELKPLDARGGAALGQALAQLHRSTGQHYGWMQHNFLGSTPQRNEAEPDWTRFWREQRLAYQLNLAGKKDERLKAAAEGFLPQVEALLAGHAPAASLLHGDLWAGNAAQDARGRPAIFDPAVYYGDREAEIAMLELFGGFGPEVLTAYQAAWPLDPGYAGQRRELYQLYHLLNHFNLFGGHYADQALFRIERLQGRA